MEARSSQRAGAVSPPQETPLFDQLSDYYASAEAQQLGSLPREATHQHGDESEWDENVPAEGIEDPVEDADDADALVRSVAPREMIASPNHSSRGDAKVRLLIVHTAEGARTVESLGAWFADASREVSSHAGIDDKRIETYVPYDRAAWTCLKANPISENVELCGFAAWTRDEWLTNHQTMLRLTAQWLVERAKVRGIPLRKLTPAQVAAGQSGVIGHVDWTLGAHDGTHTDPGPGFPWDKVMEMAVGSVPAPAPVVVGPPPAVGLMVNQGTWEPGTAARRTLSCPVGPRYLTRDGYFSLVVGWKDATDVTIDFVGARQADGTRVSLGHIGPVTLPYDDWRPFRIPRGTAQISVTYTSENPLGWATELSAVPFP